MNYTVIDKHIGKAIRTARIAQGIRLTQYAEALNVTKQALSFYETGQRSIPEDIFYQSCTLLKLNPSKVLKEATKAFVEARKDSV